MIIAGVGWALSGYTTAEWTSGLRLFADAWIPWAAVGQVALLDSLRAGGGAWRRGLVKAALPSVFAVLLGEVFLAMIGAGFGVLFANVLHWVEHRRDLSLPRVRVRWLAAAGLAVVLAFAAGAAVIVPARMLLGSTERAGQLSRWVAEACSVHPLRLIEFALPQCMGDAYGSYPAASIIGEPRLDGLPLSYSMYLGASMIALMLAAFGRGRRVALALGGLASFALLLALGKYTPVHAVFRRIVFPLAYMRYPEKYTVLLVTMVALLASMGAKRILSNEAQPWRRTSVLLALIVALGIIATFVLPPAWMLFALHGALLGSLACLGMLAVHFLAARASPLAPLLLVAIVAFDLAAAAWPLQGFGPRRIASELPLAARLALDRRSDPQAPPRLYRSNQTDQAVNKWVPANSNAEGEFRLVSTLVTNTANAWGIATLPGYDAAIPALVDSVWDAGLAVGQNALRLLGADYAVLPVADPAAAKNDRPGLEPLLDPLPGARLYRVPLALPRVFLARHAEVLPDDQALRAHLRTRDRRRRERLAGARQRDDGDHRTARPRRHMRLGIVQQQPRGSDLQRRGERLCHLRRAIRSRLARHRGQPASARLARQPHHARLAPHGGHPQDRSRIPHARARRRRRHQPHVLAHARRAVACGRSQKVRCPSPPLGVQRVPASVPVRRTGGAIDQDGHQGFASRQIIHSGGLPSERTACVTSTAGNGALPVNSR
jgi:hypothetical protein